MQEKLSVEKIWGEFVVQIFRLNGLYIAVGNRLTKSTGQTNARWQVLSTIYGQTRTVSETARQMGLSRQSVQRIANALRSDDLVKISVNPNDKRAPILHITKKGKIVMKKIVIEQINQAKQWSGKMPIKTVIETTKILQIIEKICRE